MVQRIDLFTVKRTTLFFWAAWLSMVAATNILDGLWALGALPPAFAFTSGNWGWINRTMDPLGVPRWTQALLFLGAIAWEAVAATLFSRACLVYRGRPLSQETEAVAACAVNLALWAAFQILDEVFLAYQPEAVHRVIFLNQLATVLILHLLPSASPMSGRDGP
jgi:hypothetical protein